MLSRRDALRLAAGAMVPAAIVPPASAARARRVEVVFFMFDLDTLEEAGGQLHVLPNGIGVSGPGKDAEVARVVPMDHARVADLIEAMLAK